MNVLAYVIVLKKQMYTSYKRERYYMNNLDIIIRAYIVLIAEL